jgi:hypothetical protein
VPRAILLLEKARDHGYISEVEAAYGFPSDAEVSSSRQATYTTSGQTVNCCLCLFNYLDTVFARAGKAPTVTYGQMGSNVVTLMHAESRSSMQRLVAGSIDLRRIVYPVAEALYGIMQSGGPVTVAMRETVANTPHLETDPVIIGKRKRDDSSIDDGESLGASSASGSDMDGDGVHMEIACTLDRPPVTHGVAPIITTVRDDGNHRAVHSRSVTDGRTMWAVDAIHQTIAPRTACAVGNLLALLERGVELLADLLEEEEDVRVWPACRIDLCTQSVNPLLLHEEHAMCIGRHHRAAYAIWGCSMTGASMHIPPDAAILRHLAHPKELYMCERSPYDGAILLLYARQCMLVEEEDGDTRDDDAYGLLVAREDYPQRFGQPSVTVQLQEAEIERMLARMVANTMRLGFEDSSTHN